MRFLERVHFRWNEPKAFTKLQDAFEMQSVMWWVKPACTAAGAAFLIGNWYLATLRPENQQTWPGVWLLPLAIAGGAFPVYVVPWLIALCPSEVRFYDSFMMRSRGTRHFRMKYADLESYSWRVRDDFATLILRPRKSGKEILIGVPPDVSRDAIVQFFAEHHVGTDARGFLASTK